MVQINCVLQGDILVRAFHASTSAILGKHFSQIFHFTFNTDFLRKDVRLVSHERMRTSIRTHTPLSLSCINPQQSLLLRMHRDEIDDIGTSARFPSTFHVDCEMEPLDDTADASAVVMNRSSSVRASGPSRNALPVDSSQKQLPKTGSSAQLQTAPPPIMGWLYKQGGFVKNWKKRWFVARDGKIMYFHGASDPTPLGTVDLRRVTVDVCEPHEMNARNQCLYYFKIVPPQRDQRTYYFGADTEQEMVRWIRALGTQSGYGIQTNADNGRSNSNAGRGKHEYSASMNEDRGSFRGSVGGSERYSDSRVAYSQPEALPISVLSITSPPGGVDSVSRFSGAAVRSSRGQNATELTYMLRQSAANRESMSKLQAQRQSSVRDASVSLTENDDDDSDAHAFTNAKALPTYVASKPIAFEPLISENERMTMLQEVENFGGGIYVYSADELSEIARLQKYLRATASSDRMAPLSTVLQQLVTQRRLAEAEELLVDVVIKFFSRLIDAMDYDPIAFTQMVVDTQQSAQSSHSAQDYSGGVFF